MKREQVDSSSLRSVGYDAREQTMEVEFHNGSVYEYLDVPESEHGALLSADSLGRHFNAEIKPHYRFRKVRPPDE